VNTMSSTGYCPHCHGERFEVNDGLLWNWTPVIGWERNVAGCWVAIANPGARGIKRYDDSMPVRCRECGNRSDIHNILHGEQERNLSKEVQCWSRSNVSLDYPMLTRIEESHELCGVWSVGFGYRAATMKPTIDVPRFIGNRLVLSTAAVPGRTMVEVKWVAPTPRAPPRARTAFLVLVDNEFLVGSTPHLATAKAAAHTKALLRKQVKTEPVASPTRMRARV